MLHTTPWSKQHRSEQNGDRRIKMISETVFQPVLTELGVHGKGEHGYKYTACAEAYSSNLQYLWRDSNVTFIRYQHYD